MGLGKTCQVISFLSAIMDKTGDARLDRSIPELSPLEELELLGEFEFTKLVLDKDAAVEPNYDKPYPILIVCPSSLIDNWGNEFDKWGTFRAVKLVGSAKKLDEGLEKILHGKAEVAIASYERVRINVEKFEVIPWHAAIFDEVHKVKSPKAQLTIAAHRLQTKLRFGLSGTPMPNGYEELFNVIDFLNPGSLGSAEEFKNRFSVPLRVGMQASASLDEIAEVS